MTVPIQCTPEETFVLNLGPQHPATHGVLRVKLTMDGEYIVKAEPVLGYIHRMHEKMAESGTFAQFMPNTPRMDYLSALSYNQGYVMAVERAAGIEVPERAEYIRTITVELNRISSHLLWFGAFVLDLGGFTPLLYAFDDREKILDLLEYVTGSRLTYCYYRFGGVYNDIDDAFIAGTREFIKRLRARLKPMYHDLVTGNIILIKRLKDIGFVTAETCRKYGATGPVLRGSGVEYDVRKNEPYSIYPELDFDIPTYPEGDSMARYMVRMDEIVQSLRIIEQALDKLPDGPVQAKVPKALKPDAGDYYAAVEAARGIFGCRLVCDGGKNPYRLKLRSPTFSNLSLFGEIAEGMLLADALAFMGSLDLVIPCIDR
ncbi:MAG: NADH-quinone oxidoreductase subunit NuoD [Desulfobulbaceae bacterium]